MAHHAAFHECHLLPGVPQERQVYRTSPSGETDMRAPLVSNGFQMVLCEGALVLRLDEENMVYLRSPKRTGNLTSTFKSPGTGTPVQTNLQRAVNLV
jgi:hypothetical protein